MQCFNHIDFQAAFRWMAQIWSHLLRAVFFFDTNITEGIFESKGWNYTALYKRTHWGSWRVCSWIMAPRWILIRHILVGKVNPDVSISSFNKNTHIWVNLVSMNCQTVILNRCKNEPVFWITLKWTDYKDSEHMRAINTITMLLTQLYKVTSHDKSVLLP